MGALPPGGNIMPTLPTGSPALFKTTAYVSGRESTVRMISRLYSTLVCGVHPAAGPTLSSFA